MQYLASAVVASRSGVLVVVVSLPPIADHVAMAPLQRNGGCALRPNTSRVLLLRSLMPSPSPQETDTHGRACSYLLLFLRKRQGSNTTILPSLLLCLMAVFSALHLANCASHFGFMMSKNGINILVNS